MVCWCVSNNFCCVCVWTVSGRRRVFNPRRVDVSSLPLPLPLSMWSVCECAYVCVCVCVCLFARCALLTTGICAFTDSFLYEQDGQTERDFSHRHTEQRMCV